MDSSATSSSSSSQRCWSSDIPRDLLGRIGKCFDGSRLHILRFRAVCRSWRSSTPLPPIISSYLDIPTLTKYPEKLVSCVIETTIYSIQPLSDSTIPCWFLRVQHKQEGSDQDTNAILEQYQCCRLDKLDSPYNYPLPKAINLLDFKVYEICNDYRVGIPGWEIRCTSPVAVSSCFKKIGKPNGDGFAVMAMHRDYYRLALWRMGVDDKWTLVFDPNNRAHYRFTKFLYSRGKFYVFNWEGLALSLDPAPDSDLKLTQVAPPPAAGNHQFDNCSLHYVLECCGVILGMFWLDEKTYDMQVARLDEEEQQWIKESGTGGGALKDHVAFFGPYLLPFYSFVCLAKYLPGYKPNCIYMDKATYPNRHPPSKPVCGHSGSKLVVFEMENSHA
ncbi:hypothetical protein Tsubulata_002703 [Turnera subulata]|uniref:KIB1-4 beta-propeller domain-containing protein n=1 Tax=Turnera subulata TaxID=218843 RepID=A0A9Q0JP09_9ROSI|nr:hypothetical protein Tsubulata_002703 [Turnera subulata]